MKSRERNAGILWISCFSGLICELINSINCPLFSLKRLFSPACWSWEMFYTSFDVSSYVYTELIIKNFLPRVNTKIFWKNLVFWPFSRNLCPTFRVWRFIAHQLLIFEIWTRLEGTTSEYIDLFFANIYSNYFTNLSYVQDKNANADLNCHIFLKRLFSPDSGIYGILFKII